MCAWQPSRLANLVLGDRLASAHLMIERDVRMEVTKVFDLKLVNNDFFHAN